MEITIPVREICGTSSNDQPNPGQRNPSYQERLLLLQIVAKGNVRWARVATPQLLNFWTLWSMSTMSCRRSAATFVATPQLLNSMVNVDDIVQKIGSHLRLRFERFDYDSNRVAICEGCTYCKGRLLIQYNYYGTKLIVRCCVWKSSCALLRFRV